MSSRWSSLLVFVFVAGAFVFSGASANGHEIFQDVLKETYTLKSFSCKACHPDSKNRKLRTPFADRIFNEMKSLNLSEKYAAAVKQDEAAKAKDPDSVGKDKGAVSDFEKEVAVEFKKAFKEVAKQKLTIDEMISTGLFNGARLDTKKLEAKKAEKAEKK